MYKIIASIDHVLVRSVTSKHHAIIKTSSNQVFDQTTIVLAYNDFAYYAIIQSSIHYSWITKTSADIGSTGRYNVSKSFKTFPFPKLDDNKVKLNSLGEHYSSLSTKLSQKAKLGLTKMYNAFHAKEIQTGISSAALQGLDQKAIEKKWGKEVWNLWNHLQKNENVCSIEEAIAGIIKLRELHVQMDTAVLDAYGWNDIALRHDFYDVDYLPENDRERFTIHPDARKEVLKRLLELNHKIHEEEVEKGLWDTKGKKKKGYLTSDDVISIAAEQDSDYGPLFKQND
jgi:hypothetical protein